MHCERKPRSVSCARASRRAADDQSQFTPDCRKDNHHRSAFIRVIRGPFLPGFSTTDYTDYTDGRETGSDRANKSLRPADARFAAGAFPRRLWVGSTLVGRDPGLARE
jgi:hypothetical protein